MKTWNLTLTPPDGPVTTHEGLSESQTMEALYDLMHGRDALHVEDDEHAAV